MVVEISSTLRLSVAHTLKMSQNLSACVFHRSMSWLIQDILLLSGHFLNECLANCTV